MDADAARSIARTLRQHDSRSLPGANSPEDLMNAYRVTPVSDGFVYSPVVSNLKADPRLRAEYPFYAVRSDGSSRRTPWEAGFEAACRFVEGPPAT